MTLLLVEDDPALAGLYRDYLSRSNFEVMCCDTGRAARAALTEGRFAAVLLDLQLPDDTGIKILEWLSNRSVPLPPVVVITANGSIGTAVASMRAGASDFLVKPFTRERLLSTLENAIGRSKLRQIVTEITASETEHYQGFVGASDSMRDVYRMIDVAARSKAPVFINGESGVGKELAAQAIHQRGPRRNRRFVALNCAAIPKDLMESEIFGHVKGAFTGAFAERDGAASQADGGTLFFDEICEMDLGLQAKLLRFIQTGTVQKVGGAQAQSVDVRFISATNRDPLVEVEAGRFREDLYYRLFVMPLLLPPLRARGEDILIIARRFLVEYAREEERHFDGFSPEAAAALLAYDWPGNVRQLQNVIRQVVLLSEGGIVTPEMLPAPLCAQCPPRAPARAQAAEAAPMRLPGADWPAPVPTAPVPTAPASTAPTSTATTSTEVSTPARASVTVTTATQPLIWSSGPASMSAAFSSPLSIPVPPPRLAPVHQALGYQEVRPVPVEPSRPEPNLPEPNRLGSDRTPKAAEDFSLARLEASLIELALTAAEGNVPQAAALLGISASTLYRKRNTGGLDGHAVPARRRLQPLAQAEAETIEAALAAHDGNIQRAAVALGINPSTLYRKIGNRSSHDLPVASGS